MRLSHLRTISAPGGVAMRSKYTGFVEASRWPSFIVKAMPENMAFMLATSRSRRANCNGKDFQVLSVYKAS